MRLIKRFLTTGTILAGLAGLLGCGEEDDPILPIFFPNTPAKDIAANERDLVTMPLGTSFTYRLENAPNGMEINPSTNEIEWIPNYTDSGEHLVKVIGENEYGEVIESENVIFTVSNTPCYKIAFQSQQDGNNELYIMNEDGSGLERFTNDPGWDGQQVWSPDGSKIAFISDRKGTINVFVKNSNGTGLVNLGEGTHPSWSPSGDKLAFDSYRSGNSEIHTANPDGTNLEQLTNGADGGGPVWSPTGDYIAFSSNGNICKVKAGEIPITLTNSGSDLSPVWSPDGNYLAFNSSRDGNYEIYKTDKDGVVEQDLTQNIAHDFGSDWSPDGQEIVFYSERTGDHEIYKTSSDGVNLEQLTNNPGVQDMAPKHSPDGEKIVYVSGEVFPGNSSIWVMNSYGSGKTQLTYSSSWNSVPRWSPNKE